MSCRIRTRAPISIINSSLEKSFLEVAFEISPFYTISSVLIAKRIFVNFVKKTGFTRFKFKNANEEHLVVKRINSIILSLKSYKNQKSLISRQIGPGKYFASLEYIRYPDGKPLILNLDRLNIGLSPLLDIEPFIKSNKQFFYCPEINPEIRCPAFNTFFKILQMEGFIYNIEVG